MAEVSTTPEGPTPKKGSKKPSRAKASHPTTAVMVNSAIKSLKERGGSSLQAIKKYVASTYKVDAEKLSPFIKKFLKTSVASGVLVQTKGKGASGSFKLANTVIPKTPVEKKPKPTPKKAKPAKPAKASPRKAPAKREAPKKSPKKVTPKVTPVKAKKVVKTPQKSPKKAVKKTLTKAKRTAPKRK